VKEYTVKVYANGDKFWFNKDGDPHCEHGPAIVLGSGHTRYYLNGERLTQEEWENRLKSPCSGKVVEYEGVKYKLVEV